MVPRGDFDVIIKAKVISRGPCPRRTTLVLIAFILRAGTFVADRIILGYLFLRVLFVCLDILVFFLLFFLGKSEIGQTARLWKKVSAHTKQTGR